MKLETPHLDYIKKYKLDIPNSSATADLKRAVTKFNTNLVRFNDMDPEKSGEDKDLHLQMFDRLTRNSADILEELEVQFPDGKSKADEEAAAKKKDDEEAAAKKKGTGLSARAIQLRGSFKPQSGLCRPRVYVDGLIFLRGDSRAPGSDANFDIERLSELGTDVLSDSPLSIDDVAHPSTIAGIEVYRSGAQVPVQFGGTSVETQCGVIVIWTRVGRMRGAESGSR